MEDSENIYNDIKSPVVRRMLRNFRLSEDAESDNRARALYAMNFRRGGKDQWDETMLKLRDQGNRPSESYNQIPQFLHRVTNNARQNMPQTAFIPGDDGSQHVAELREELARTIQTSSEGEVAYDNAVDSQVTIGWGYWRYVTEYCNDKTFDQDIKIKWVPNTLMVYDDPNCLEQDFSDRKYLIQVFDIDKDEFNSDREDEDRYDSDILQSIGDQQPNWATQSTVRVAEYWEVVDGETVTLYRLKAKDGKEAGEPIEKLPKGANTEDYETRKIPKPKVMWYKCTAKEVLESREWPGKYIPYVRISGEMQIVDGQVFYSGLVEPMISPQKMYNYWLNTATEIMGMVPLAPWIAAAGQLAPYKSSWDKSNVKKYPYLEYDPIDINGQVVGPPQRNSATADISGALAMVNQAQQNFYVVTGIYPASLGQASNETSGKAINARKVEADTANYHFIDNLARGQRFGGRIMEDLFPIIYDSSRTIRGQKVDGTTREVKINQKYKDESGKEQEYDMTKGSYDVVVTTGPSYATKRQEAADSQIQLAQSYPPLMQVAGSNIVRNMDWPGADDIADKLKIIEDTNFPALSQLDDKNPIPPQVKAQMEQMGQIIQELQGQLQQVGQELQSKEADIQVKQADLQLKQQDMQLKAQDQQTKSVSDQMKAENDRLKIQLDVEKLQLEREKMQWEMAKSQLESYQNEIDASQPQPIEGEEMPVSEEELLAKLEAVRNQKAQKEQETLAQQEQEQIMAEKQAMKEAEDRARSDALLQGLSGIQEMIMGLTASIAAPKQVIRNPETGLIEGVTTVGTIQ